MTRRESRESAFQVVFSFSINNIDLDEVIELTYEFSDVELDDFAINIIRATLGHIAEIDLMLQPHLKGWSIKRISKTSLAIIRISCAQIFYWDEIDKPLEGHERIVINEAVEISKKFGNDDDYLFVNGVLGSIVRNI